MAALFISILFGCGDGNYRNVNIKGVVRSSATKNPIPNAEVLIKCWVYSTQNWESNTVEETVRTDVNGLFEAKFDKGEAIDLIIKAQNFETKEESMTLKRNTIHIEVFLGSNPVTGS